MYKWTVWLFFNLIATWCCAQDETFVFSHLNESNGLSENVVNCMIKDKHGFFWIGTYNGFNRFDGANFYSYKPRKGSNTMLNEVVHSLCEDNTGKIWGATNSEVFSYDLALDQFTSYECKSLGHVTGFSNILCDRRGNVWATSNWSLHKFNPAKKQFEVMMNTTASQDSLRFYGITKNGLVEDPYSDQFWIATVSGLVCYDVARNQVTNFKSAPANPLFGRKYVSALSRSAAGHCWFFDNEKKVIVQFDPAKKEVMQEISIQSAVPNAEAATIFEDRSRRLWFSSWSYDLMIIDLAHNNKLQRLRHRPDDNRSIAGDFFWSAWQDADNTIWLGTVAGISRCNPERNIYKEYRLGNTIPALKNTALHLSVQDPADKSTWMVNRNGELIHYDPATEKYEITEFGKAVKNAKGDLPGYLYSLRFVDDKVVATTSTGAWQLVKGSGVFKPFTVLPKAYEDFFCRELVTDGDSVIYYNSGKQILYWNREHNITKVIPVDSAMAKMPVYGLHVTPAHTVWMITSDNKIAQLISKHHLEVTDIIKDKRKEAGTIMSVRSDIFGNIWVLNKGAGLYKYDPVKKTVQFWNQTDGLTGNRIHAMMPDSTGRVWTMLYDKVSVYIPSANKFYNFKIPYSESNLNYYNHLSKTSDGHILGTIYNEIVEFYPERLLTKPALEKPLISLMSVGNKDFQLLNNSHIYLNATENTVRFKFGTLINRNIFPYDLEYKLGNAENHWTVAGENAEANYNNLAPGKYEFHVRVVGKNNAWQSEEAILYFVIKTPFYKSGWFYAAAVLLFFAALYLFYRFRIKQKEKLMLLETKAQALEKEKALVMYENLKQHLNPHFLFNSLTSLSSLIRLDQQMAGDFLDKMSKVYRYILKNRDNEVVPLGEEMKFVQLYIGLQKTRFNEGLQVNMHIDEEFHHRKIAPVTLQNLVENAIKHNTADEAFPLVIELFVENDFLVVRNNLQKKKFVETSNRQGLVNMESLYRYLSIRPMEIHEDEQYFTVKIPLL
ncbi:MAG: histidine kinase [Ferruginibacter sp.]